MKHHIMLNICWLFILTSMTYSQQIRLISGPEVIVIASGGSRNKSFYQSKHQLDCGMPQLYILPDSSHTNYSISTSDVKITSIQGLWNTVEVTLICQQQKNSCEAKINNQCNLESQKHQINRIKIETSIGPIQYLVDCNPTQFYKPFQIGLFLLILLSTITITLSSLYSKAWSYHGYGYSLTSTAVLIFNLILLLGIVLGYLLPDVLSITARIIGSVVGACGVAVCVSELVWLLKSKKMLSKVYKKIRILDILSGAIGLSCIPLYWLVNGQWFINDIMAICSIVALMKLIKIKSLSLGVLLLLSLLLMQTLVGLFVHYVFKISYNNYIINIFQNPIVLVMPSITRQIYRSCAWMPISTVLFPGLVLSYFRRFDLSRSTFLYHLIGLGAFYVGSILWMIIDLQTVHSLPFAIISEPVTILIVCVQSFRRNEFRILWNGTFHDEETSQHTETLLPKETEIVSPKVYQELTDNLRMSNQTQSSDSYQVVPVDGSKM